MSLPFQDNMNKESYPSRSVSQKETAAALSIFLSCHCLSSRSLCVRQFTTRAESGTPTRKLSNKKLTAESRQPLRRAASMGLCLGVLLMLALCLLLLCKHTSWYQVGAVRLLFIVSVFQESLLLFLSSPGRKSDKSKWFMLRVWKSPHSRDET